MRNFPMMLLFACLVLNCSTHSHVVDTFEDMNADLEESGSPYRWVMTSQGSYGSAAFQRQIVGQPCVSAADAMLSADTLSNIGAIEVRFGGSPNPVLTETRCLPIDAGGAVSEIWVIAREDKSIPYVVKYQADPSGGVNMDIKGPW